MFTETCNALLASIMAQSSRDYLIHLTMQKCNLYVIKAMSCTMSMSILYFAIYSASTGGTQRTDWQALGAPRALTAGDKLEWAPGALDITLT